MKFCYFKQLMVGLLGAIILVGCENSKSEGQSAKAATQKSQTAKVQMTEYFDFECPTCAYFYPIVKKLKKHYGKKLDITYRYFPLNMHQYSMLAARAAEAAHQQGKYIAMHDLLFENQDAWSQSSNPQPIFIGYAKQIGLNMKQFKHDLNAGKTQKTVMTQKKAGLNRGVNATPTFYINGEQVVNNPRTYKAFKALIDLYMKEANNKSSS